MSSPLRLRAASLVVVGALALAVRGIVSAIRAERSLSRLDPPELAHGIDAVLKFRVIVPVLHEHHLIEKSYATFSKLAEAPNVEVVFVSTDAEEERRRNLSRALRAPGPLWSRNQLLASLRYAFGAEIAREMLSRPEHRETVDLELLRRHVDEQPTTNELLKRLVAREPGPRVFRVHLKGPAFSMALQVRAGAEASLTAIPTSSQYLAIYNVDSNPEPSTFQSAERQIGEIRRTTGHDPDVLQQSSTFLGAEASSTGPIEFAAGLSQTRWTFGTEMAKLRRQAATAGYSALPPVLGICVGHGLFVRGEFFRDEYHLPTFIMQEDLAYGFLLSASRIPVYSLRTLDRADTPRTLKALNAQKQQWFWAYLEYWKVSRYARVRGASAPACWFLLLQAAGDAALWLGTSPGVWSAVLLPVLRPRLWLISAVGVTSYVIWPYLRYVVVLRRRGHSLRWPTLSDVWASFVVTGTDSVGPYRAIAAIANKRKSVTRSRTGRA